MVGFSSLTSPWNILNHNRFENIYWWRPFFISSVMQGPHAYLLRRTAQAFHMHDIFNRLSTPNMKTINIHVTGMDTHCDAKIISQQKGIDISDTFLTDAKKYQFWTIFTRWVLKTLMIQKVTIRDCRECWCSQTQFRTICLHRDLHPCFIINNCFSVKNNRTFFYCNHSSYIDKNCCQHKKWRLFCKRLFQMHFVEWTFSDYVKIYCPRIEFLNVQLTKRRHWLR